MTIDIVERLRDMGDDPRDVSMGELAEYSHKAADEIERLRAELAKYKPQPINTAPRDGTPILVSGGTMVYELGEDEPNKSMVKVTGETWSTNWYAVDTCGYMVEVHNPTHWMPLPQPQKENGDDQ